MKINELYKMDRFHNLELRFVPTTEQHQVLQRYGYTVAEDDGVYTACCELGQMLRKSLGVCDANFFEDAFEAFGKVVSIELDDAHLSEKVVTLDRLHNGFGENCCVALWKAYLKWNQGDRSVLGVTLKDALAPPIVIASPESLEERVRTLEKKVQYLIDHIDRFL